MKKSLFIVALLTATSFGFAQQTAQQITSKGAFSPLSTQKMKAPSDIKYIMTGYDSSDEMEYGRYTWDEKNRIICKENEFVGDYSIRDSVFYDDKDQIIKIKGYQLMEEGWKNTYYVDYTYYDNGDLKTRTNYNNFNNEFQLGGVYTYYYDENHNITKSELEMMNMLFEVITYTYQDGKLVELEGVQNDFNDNMLPSYKTTYEYNTQGYLRKEVFNIYSNQGYVLEQTKTYDYEDGNLMTYKTMDKYGVTQNKYEYDYDTDMLAANTLLPITPELEHPFDHNCKNAYIVRHFYMADQSNVLQYMFDYNYRYKDITTGINNNTTMSNFYTVVSNNGENVYIKGGLNNSEVKVYSLDGTIVKTAKTNANGEAVLNINNMKKGVYIINNYNNTVKIRL